jgi:fatty acid-binding protein DegV
VEPRPHVDPFVLGRSVVAVVTSRHIIGTYTAAMSASRVLKDRGLDARIIDSRCTDLGAGLPTLLAAQAARAGMPIDDVVALVESFCAGVSFALVPDTLDWLVKSGKATALKPPSTSYPRRSRRRASGRP